MAAGRSRRRETTPDTELIEELRKYDTATVSNAIEKFGVRSRLDGYAIDLICQYPDLPPMVGYAVTCSAETAADTAEVTPGWRAVADAVHRAPKPAILVIGWRGQDRARGCVIGDMGATGLAKLGVVGIVTDSYFRDRSGIRGRAQSLQLFARGTVASHGRPHFVDVGEPAVVGGLLVKAGELLHGDENGLVTVPAEIAQRLPRVARDLQEAEQRYFEAIEKPNLSFAEIRTLLAPRE